ncbi:hypothetical protein BON67_23570 [Escherichia coli]|uniref:Uncharacterized protein n=1 Tax=Escherichia coli MS 85-1 TaxID=679202 RepID=A0AAN3M446_ECOLX|nr:conserved hypothetical protein [Escherichia coli UMNK88]ALL91119.1 hypothetical protein MJ49_26965 [Escherichia coli]AMU80957.1 hypothetical protein Y979_01755 [Escherichia coli str. Sanji]EFI87864.1 hypothetical protein HMPREF9551_03149 [Escherichia coli MS 196-1]EFJ89124.1 hypothetical protein HMPREF9536_00528 [Escherichia coli MS 84-1]EFK17532.1 hypothetical protein HMPREF9541_00057 [Escherichia coli MS 116-1]EFK24940.1 hypothetical protein HMPREF9550_02965 [Escherichia coli MS 187-1]E
MTAHVASLRCISLIIKGLHLVRSVNSRRKHIQTASLRHVMGFPHRGLLRKLRQPARHRSHAPLTSVADLPRFTCLDSGILRRLPVALFILACRKLAEVSNASVIDAAAPVFRIHVKTPSTGSAYVSLPVPPARPVRSRRPW